MLNSVTSRLKSLGYRELDKAGREERAQAKASVGRLSGTVFGGVSLIGPMLIMTLHSSQKTSLIVLATMLFAVAVAVFAEDTSSKDVLAATAAYAAVLVVFVGTSSGSNGASAAS